MDKTAIKNFAIWARRKLISDMRLRAGFMGITENGIAAPLPASTSEIQYFDISSSEPVKIQGIEIQMRGRIVAQLEQHAKESGYQTAYDSLIENMASVWFNRLIALRYMEVNEYFPDQLRMLSSVSEGKQDPDIVSLPFDSDLEFSEKERKQVNDWMNTNKQDAVFRFLLLKRCNQLAECLPGLFEKQNDASEFFLRLGFVEKDGLIYHLVHDIEEDAWTDQVQIIGWLYQYYNTEPKAAVFGRKSGTKIKKEEVPAATQLFTPDWIVRYMVENSLGRLVISGRVVDSGQWGADSEKERIRREQEIADGFGWKYYLPEAEQEPDVQTQLAELREEYSKLRPEDLRCIDPCAGSGHILVYLFDVLMQIYETQGYTKREAAQSILKNNLYGLDIDDRAAQLAYFAVMMKARQYDRRILARGIQPHMYAVQESNGFHQEHLKYFGEDLTSSEKSDAIIQIQGLIKSLYDAKEYGSILSVDNMDWALLRQFADRLDEGQLDFDAMGIDQTQELLKKLIDVGEILAQQYDVTVTNPPYMAVSNASPKLQSYVKKNYPDSKADLFAVFIERCGEMTVKNHYQAMITQHAWMFLSSYEKLRNKLQQRDTVNMAHLGARAFEEIGGEVVQTTSFVMRKNHTAGYKGIYCRLIEPNTQQKKEEMFFAGKNRHTAQQFNFAKIPGSPVAYWVSGAIYEAFAHTLLGDMCEMRKGSDTGKNDLFVRLWWEPDILNVDFENHSKKWVPYLKGGEARKWYGHRTFLVNWENDGYEIRHFSGSTIRNEGTFYRAGITWSDVGSNSATFRYFPGGMLRDNRGPAIFPQKNEEYILGFLNSNVCSELQTLINPTICFQLGSAKTLPIILDEKQLDIIKSIVKENIYISCADWDAFETSWDFTCHPLIQSVLTVEAAFDTWEDKCNDRFVKLKANEEELNHIFIDIYGLQDELTPEVEDKDVTVRLADKSRDIRSFISYAVGCMFGRYSLDVDGLTYAGGRFSDQWVVISGQCYPRKVVEYYVSQELSRTYRVAEVNGSGDGDLPTGETVAEGGVVFTFGSDEAGSSVNPIQHRRGTGKKLYEGICKLSVDCAGIEGGAGDPAYDLCSPEILNAIASGDGTELVSRGWKDAERIDWKTIHYTLTTNHYSPDEDNVIPITDQKYLPDDIVELFCEFLKVVYGEEKLEENLDFIANALGGKGLSSREVIRKYFLNDFFKDHCRIYQKRPIYWLFDSGKQNGFKALVYMHRWDKNSVGRVLMYLHKIQEKYEIEVRAIDTLIEHITDKRQEAVEERRRDHLLKQIAEIKEYDERLEHMANEHIDIDLDDGVKENYEKVQKDRNGTKYKILAPIK